MKIPSYRQAQTNALRRDAPTAGGVSARAVTEQSPDAMPRAQPFFVGGADERNLPAEASDLLDQLRDARDAAHAAFTALGGEVDDARAAALNARGRLNALTDPAEAMRQHGLKTVYGADHPSVVDATRKLNAAQATLEKLLKRRAGHEAQFQPLAAVVSRIDAYLAEAGGAALASAPAPKLAKGDTVEAMRQRVAELRADLHEVRSAPRPSAFAKAKARAEIEALADAGEPHVLGLVEHGEGIRFATAPLAAQVHGHVANAEQSPLAALVHGSIPNGIALVAWLMRDQLVAAIEALVDDVGDDEHALTDAQRAEREAALQAQILAIERRECAIITAEGSLAFRADVDPRAILGVDGPAPGEN